VAGWTLAQRKRARNWCLPSRQWHAVAQVRSKRFCSAQHFRCDSARYRLRALGVLAGVPAVSQLLLRAACSDKRIGGPLAWTSGSLRSGEAKTRIAALRSVFRFAIHGENPHGARASPLRLRRCAKKATAKKLRIIIAEMEGSGTAPVVRPATSGGQASCRGR
jgi:hypothetical protein